MISIGSFNPDISLGGQLFQIAAAIGSARVHNVPWGIGHWRYRRYFTGPFPECSDGSGAAIHEWFGQRFRPIHIDPSRDVHLTGLFRSERYFDAAREDVVSAFRFEPVFLEEISTRHRALLSVETCAVHVRMGKPDDSDRVTVLPAEYYERAMDAFGPGMLFVVLSDDPDRCRELLGDAPNRIFVKGQSDIEDLCFMTLCNHAIVGNSATSWWGAYLNRSRDRRVIAPEHARCFRGADSSDYFPREFRQIPFEVSPADEPPFHQAPPSDHNVRHLVQRNNPVILEIGCNDGGDSVRFLKMFPDVVLHCFEPDPRPAARFRARVRDSRCAFHQVAIGATVGTAEFHLSVNSPVF